MLYAAQSGPVEVVASGSLSTFMGHPLEVVCSEPGDRLVRVVFEFESVENEAVQVRSEAIPDGLRLTCVNFDTPEGRGSAQPVLLGEIEDDLYFLHFRVFRYGRTVDHTVQFTVYRGTKRDLGWSPEG